MQVTDEDFNDLFSKLDADGDGAISYKDFSITVGSEIHPAEGLYFRQDKPTNAMIRSCRETQCWQATQSYAFYCALH